MKKLITLILILSLSVFMFGCSDKKDTETNESTDATEAVVGGLTLPNVEEQVIYEENGVVVKVKGGQLEKNALDHVIIPLSIENNSAKNFKLSLKNSTINGITADHYNVLAIDCKVEANSTVDASISIDDDLISMFNIVKLGDLKFDLVGEFDGEEVVKEDVEIKTSLTGKTEQTFNPSGTNLINENGINLTVTDKLQEGLVGPELKFYLVNNSNKHIQFANVGDFTINDITVPAAFSFGVGSTRKTIYNLVIMKSDLEAAGVELPIKSLKFTISGKDAEIMGEDVFTPININMSF